MATERTKSKPTMLEYIERSPLAVEEYLSSALDSESEDFVALLLDRRPLIITGCSTSFSIAQAAARFFDEIAGIDCRAVPSFDLENYTGASIRGKILIAISQSGTTRATLGAIARARSTGIWQVVGVSASGASPMEQVVDFSLPLPGERERAMAKTLTFSLGSVMFLRLASAIADRLTPGLRRSLEPASDLGRRLRRALDDNRPTIEAAAAAWASWKDFVLVGAGPAWPTALEIGSRMRATSYTASDGYELEEFTHGLVSSLGPRHPLILIALDGPGWRRSGDLLASARHVGCPTMLVVEDGVGLDGAEYVLRIGGGGSEHEAAIVASLPLQLFTHQLAVCKGIDPDTMRRDVASYDEVYNDWLFPPGVH